MSVEIKDNSSEAIRNLKESVAKALEVMGILAEGYAVNKCPVDTGKLKGSISHLVDDNTVYIGTDVEYAAYVEMGTIYTRAQPYLEPAVVEHFNEYMKVAESFLRG